jgi:uncharacterized coiled-coil protein SlyX
MSSDSDPLPVTRRRWPWLLLCAILGFACAAGVYAWPEIATLVHSLGHQASRGGPPANDKDALPDLLATQQKSEEDLAALGRAVVDQQEQLKSIVDQLVALTSKVEALQRAALAPASIPSPAAAEPPRAPIAQAAPRSRKLPSPAPKPSGPISTGGTPLSAAPGLNAPPR